MQISNFKYIITNIGGGWGYTHLLWGITPDGKVYETEYFNEDNFELSDELKCDYIGQLENIELGLREPHKTAIMDGTHLNLYDVANNFEVIYSSPQSSGNDPDLYININELRRKAYKERHEALKKETICEKSENKDMLISDFKYMFINIGGGWSYYHDLFGVTQDGEVYLTSNFKYKELDVNTKLNFDFIGKLRNTKLKLKRHPSYSVLDAPDLHVYRVSNKLILLQKAPDTDENNPGMYKDIRTLLYIKATADYEKIKTDKNIVLSPGEIKSKKQFREAMSLINRGHPVQTTFHASTNSSIVNQLRKELLSNGNNLIDRDEHKLTKAEQKDLNNFLSNINSVLERQDKSEYKLSAISEDRSKIKVEVE